MNEQGRQKTLKEDETVAIILVLLMILFAALWWFFGLLQGTAPKVEQSPAISELIAPTPKGKISEIDQSGLLGITEHRYEAGKVDLKGQGIPNTKIEVYLNERKIGETKVDVHGNWKHQINIEKAGRYEMFARSLNEDGSSNDSDPFEFRIVDQATPIPATIRPILTPTVIVATPTRIVITSTPDLNIKAPQINSPTINQIIPFGEVQLAGQGEPNKSFNLIFDNGGLTKIATVQGDGKWQLLLPIGALKSGKHTVMTQIQEGEVELAKSEPVSFDLMQPLPSRWQNGINGYIREKGVYTVRGTGQPNWRVAYQIGNTPLTLANTDANGNWAVEYPFTEPKEYVMQVLSVDADGSTIGSADVAKVIIFDPTKVPADSQPIHTPTLSNTTGVTELVAPAVSAESTPALSPTQQVAAIIVTPTVSAESTPALSPTQQVAAIIVTPTVSAESTSELSPTQEVVAVVTPTVSAESTPELSPTQEVAAIVSPTVSAESTPALSPTQQVAAIIVTPTVSAESTPALSPTQQVAAIIVTPTVSAESTPALSPTQQVAAIIVTPTVSAEVVGNTIYEQLRTSGNYNTLLAAIDKTELKEMLQNPEQLLTLFAPTDEQFANLPDGVVEGWLENPEVLEGILLNHTVSRSWTTADLEEVARWAEPRLVTLKQQILPVVSEDGVVNVNSMPIESEIVSDNGVIHPISQIFLPLPAGVIKPVIDDSGVPTFQGRNLTIVGKGTPNTMIQVELNGQPYNSTEVSADGRWLVDGSVEPGHYEIIAYTYKPTSNSASNVLCAISDTVILDVDK